MTLDSGSGSSSARVVEWQTRQFEGLVVAIPCGFKSRPAHQHESAERQSPETPRGLGLPVCKRKKKLRDLRDARDSRMRRLGAMKIISRLLLSLALLIVQVTPVNAGTVHVGLLRDSDSNKFECDGSIPVENPNSDSRCESAKFGKCSSCNSVAVTNNSEAPIDVEITLSGAGFSEAHGGGAFYSFDTAECDGPNGPEERHFSGPNPCGHLLPGKSCSNDLEFCPEQSGASHGQVKVTVRGAGAPQTTTLGLIGSANYSPELQAADEARRRHLAELMKIPHVVKVELDPKGDDIFMNVEVEQGKSLDRVRRAAPPKVEGYDVEVTTYTDVFYAL